MAASEDFDGGLQRTMHQKFRAPIKEVRFAGIKFRSALVFANGSGGSSCCSAISASG
jgi:hypothetical protein